MSVRRAAVMACALLLAALGAGSVQARTPVAKPIPVKTVSISQEQLGSTGSLVYTWQASPALGCEAAHLCGVRGALIIDVNGGSYSPEGPKVTLPQERQPAQLQLNTATATVRTQGPQPYAACVDALNLEGLSIEPIANHRHQRVSVFSEGGGDPSAGRCAGPLAQDIARLRLPLVQTGGRMLSFALHASESESAGPFTVTLHSTLTLSPAGASSSETDVSPLPTSGSHRRQYAEGVDARYRVSNLHGAVTATFTAAPSPFCITLGACGTSGTITLSPVSGQGTFRLHFSAITNTRPTAAEVLRRLRAGRLSVFGEQKLRLLATVTVMSQGAEACQSSRAEVLPVEVDGFSKPLAATLLDQAATGSVAPGSLRTYCPGPLDGDLVAENAALAAQTVTSAALAAPTITIGLAATAAPPGNGVYRGSLGGMIGMTFTRISQRVTVKRIRGISDLVAGGRR